MNTNVEGYCIVVCQDGISVWRLPRSDFPKLVLALTENAPGFRTKTIHGAELAIRISCIEAIADYSPEAIAALNVEREAQRRGEMF